MASPIASSSSDRQSDHFSTFQISHRGKAHTLQLSTSATLGNLQDEIAELINVDASHQKLLGSGSLRNVLSKAKENEEKTLEELNLVSKGETPIKIMIVGPTSDELDAVQKGDLEAEIRNRPRQYHPSMLRGGKVSECPIAAPSFSFPQKMANIDELFPLSFHSVSASKYHQGNL
jgi:hypothetical protein